MPLQHLLRLVQEHACPARARGRALGGGGSSGVPRAQEELGLRCDDTHGGGEGGDAGCGPEECAPADGNLWDEVKVDDCRESEAFR